MRVGIVRSNKGDFVNLFLGGGGGFGVVLLVQLLAEGSARAIPLAKPSNDKNEAHSGQNKTENDRNTDHKIDSPVGQGCRARAIGVAAGSSG